MQYGRLLPLEWIASLLADHDDCTSDLELSPSYRAAQRLVPLARKLVRTIADYRNAQLIERQRPLEDDLPF